MFRKPAEKKTSELQTVYTIDPKETLGNIFIHKVNVFSDLISGLV